MGKRIALLLIMASFGVCCAVGSRELKKSASFQTFCLGRGNYWSCKQPCKDIDEMTIDKDVDLVAFFKTCTEKTPEVLAQMIEKELEYPYPVYAAFYHATFIDQYALFVLRKKLYERYHGPVKDFEFFRAHDHERDRLKSVVLARYIDDKSLNDSKDPYRTELLSVVYVPWGGFASGATESLPRSSCHFDIKTQEWAGQALAAYGLRPPREINVRLCGSPIMLQIFLKRVIAQDWAYNCWLMGSPLVNENKAWKFSPQLLLDPSERKNWGQARILLNPDYFDQPNDNVKIFLYTDLTDKQKKEIDTWCDQLITEAEKLSGRERTARPIPPEIPLAICTP